MRTQFDGKKIVHTLIQLALVVCCILSIGNIVRNVSWIVNRKQATKEQFDLRSENYDFPVWISGATCKDCSKTITENNLYSHLRKGHNILIRTAGDMAESTAAGEFLDVIETEDISGFNCLDCDAAVTNDNYLDHLETGHRIMVKLSHSKSMTINEVRFDWTDENFADGVTNTGSVPVFVRVSLAEPNCDAYNKELWFKDGNYLYLKEPLSAGSSTGVIVQDGSTQIEKATVVDASMYGPDQVLKAFQMVED